MKKTTRITVQFLLCLLATTALAKGKEFNALDEIPLDELLAMEVDPEANIGNRGQSIALDKAKVPVDVITAEQINHTGYTELSKVLQRFIPGFNFPRPSITDGTDHIRPFTLRGMAPDQVLVLVNGKRLHSSSILHINGTIGRGATGVDLNTIPLHSIARVEVLRDGAAAQYGSDAIAGIINIILKSGGEERRLTTTVGQTYGGDGALYQTDLHYGVTLPLDGFIDLTAEFRDRNPTNRAILDTRQQYFAGDIRNNYPARQTSRRGDPDTQDFLAALNAEIPLSDNFLIYSHGTINYRQSEAGAFFRRPLDDRNIRAIYPDGFLPLIAPKILDYSATVGIKGETNAEIRWDLSHTIGSNELNYTVKNSLNASLGTASPTSFDAGGLSFRQHTTSFDLFKALDLGFKSPLNIAAGLEWRYETFAIDAGDEASYIDGGIPILDGINKGQATIAGSQGFPGFIQRNAVNKSRNNWATYLDLSMQFYDKLSVGLAGRYEYYSDFGSTINGKFSLGYQAFDSLLLRGSVSTGFRAPSLQQSYFESTSTIKINNKLETVELESVTDDISQGLGALPLCPETSRHFSAGLVYTPIPEFSFSVDYFYTKINDRIVLSENITPGFSPEIADVLDAEHLGAVRFFTNAINTETQGIDIRANYTMLFDNDSQLKLSALYQYNKTLLQGGVRVIDILARSGRNALFGAKEQERLESGQPNQSLILMADYQYKAFDGMLRLIRAGAFSEAGQRADSQWLADIDLAYQIHPNFNIAVGVHNLFDSTPDRNAVDGMFLQSAPYGYNGGFYYFRLSADF